MGNKVGTALVMILSMEKAMSWLSRVICTDIPQKDCMPANTFSCHIKWSSRRSLTPGIAPAASMALERAAITSADASHN